VPDTRGSGEGYLNFPDNARLLPDGWLTVADIRNCRLLFIDPKTRKTLTQWGKPGVCKHAPPATFAYPNDINYFDNGDFLVTEIPDAWISRLGPDGHVVWSSRSRAEPPSQTDGPSAKPSAWPSTRRTRIGVHSAA